VHLIRVEDVQVMVPYVQSADVIFQMVDALGQRDPRRAATDLHRLLDVGEHPLGIFGMIVRQFRLLLQIRWMSDRHQPQQQIVSRLKLHPYVVRKILAQAERFTIGQLTRGLPALDGDRSGDQAG
jgi:DNA polymerase III subunit delta